jgi:hypothetical protein
MGCAQHFVRRNIFTYIFLYVSIFLVPKHYTMNMYGEVKLQLFAMLILALIGRIKLSDSLSSRFILRKFLYVLLY